MKWSLFFFIIFLTLNLKCQKINESYKYENFDYFLIQFFGMEEFQKERTIFPLEYSYYDPSSEISSRIKTIFIKKEEWTPIQDTTFVNSKYFRKIYDNFEKKYRPTGERVFAYEGNETGIAIFYYFKLKDKKWYLIKKEDYSD